MSEGLQLPLDFGADGPAPERPVSAAPPPDAGGGKPTPTAEQRQAIGTRDRDVFLEAGAGTGKTTVLVDRYTGAVCEDGLATEKILAFTFTERAAAELRSRARAALGRRSRALRAAGDHAEAARIRRAARDTERAWILTIHGFCRRLIAQHPVAAGVDPRFRVLDEAESSRLAERAFAEVLEELVEGGNEAVAAMAAGRRRDRLESLVREAFGQLRSQGVDPPRLPDPGLPMKSAKGDAEPEPLSPAEQEEAAASYAALTELLRAFGDRYAELKAERSGLDFTDLELVALRMLRTDDRVAAAWRGRFDHLMVDEFQDTNVVQLALVDALRGPDTRLFTVGDEHQSIYRFRHADLDVFRARRADTESDPRASLLPLRGNFRSRPEIIAAVNAVAEELIGEGFEPLRAGVRDDGQGPRGGAPAVELLLTDECEDRERPDGKWAADDVKAALRMPPEEASPKFVAEARGLARRLRELADEGVPRGDMVVLLRAFTHVDAYEDALARAGLNPYVVGGRGYWSQQQVEDVLRLLGVIANPYDDEVLFGALSGPGCAASPDALWLLRAATGSAGHIWPVLNAEFGTGPEPVREAPTDSEAEELTPEEDERRRERAERRAQMLAGTPEADRGRLERFCALLAGLRAEAPLLPLEALIERTITVFDYDLALLSLPGGLRRMANVRKLMRMAREFEAQDGRDLRAFLDLAEDSTVRDEREGQAAIQVEGHDGVRIMTVHAAKGLQFPVVAVADLGRGLAHTTWLDIAIGRVPGDPEAVDSAEFGLRLVPPAGEGAKLWAIDNLEEEAKLADAEEACRLTYVAITRAEERLIMSGSYQSNKLERSDPKPTDSALRRLLWGLVERGWDGGPGVIEVPPATAISGEAAGGPQPGIHIYVSVASVGRAQALALEGLPAPAPEAEPEPQATSPLVSTSAPQAPVGHLSYSALADYGRCAYRFYVERVVGLADPEVHVDLGAAAGERGSREPDELIEPLDAEALAQVAAQAEADARAEAHRNHALAIGNAVHGALEWSARREWAVPSDDFLRGLLSRYGAGRAPEALARARELVSAWLASPLADELAPPGVRLRPEASFAINLGETVIRGQMDLLAIGDGVASVVDYKTDALNGRDPDTLAERYEVQRDLYALATWTALGKPALVKAHYSFLEAPDLPASFEYGPEDLEAARERLERLVAGIRAGRFERTPEPYRALCHGCPAAARLCGAPAWKPAWAAARA